MEIFDLTLKDIVDKQIVLVEFTPNNILSFLVGDEECPCVPGYPACSLTRFTSLKLGRLAIKKTYRRLQYFPRFYSETAIWK